MFGGQLFMGLRMFQKHALKLIEFEQLLRKYAIFAYDEGK